MPVDRAIAHEGEGDPSELVRDRYRDKLERFGFHELPSPRSKAILMGLSVEEDGMSTDDQQLSEIAIPHF